MDYPITVREEDRQVADIPSPSEIIADAYLPEILRELQECPQAWVYIVSKLLGRATPESLVKSRPGPTGTKVFYVDIDYAIATRAALARIGVASDFEVAQTDVSNEAVDCLCKLTLKYFCNGQWANMVAMQWGECRRLSGMALGDVKKGAASDGLKKCLHEFGWASDVYSRPIERAEAPSPIDMRNEQVESLYSIGGGKGLVRDAVDRFVMASTEGKSIGDLEPKDITALKRKLQRLDATEVASYRSGNGTH